MKKIFVSKESFSGWLKGINERKSIPLLLLAVMVGLMAGMKREPRVLLKRMPRVLRLTNMDWLTTLVMVSMTKVSEEQGEWAAEIALSILSGSSPQDIPIVANRKWELFINEHLLSKSGFVIPKEYMRKAVKVKF